MNLSEGILHVLDQCRPFGLSDSLLETECELIISRRINGNEFQQTISALRDGDQINVDFDKVTGEPRYMLTQAVTA